MKKLFAPIFSLFVMVFLADIAAAQGANISLGGLSHDTSLPVEVTADELEIDQGDGSASFTGNVIIGQGDMRISAGSVRVEYATASGGSPGEISRLIASGGVTFVNSGEAAEAQEATYNITTGQLVMTGGVILTQGQSALSADRLIIDLKAGTGRMVGRVKTILSTGSN